MAAVLRAKHRVKTMERKAQQEWKEISDRVVTGFSSIIGNVDDGGDLIEPGAVRNPFVLASINQHRESIYAA